MGSTIIAIEWPAQNFIVIYNITTRTPPPPLCQAAPHPALETPRSGSRDLNALNCVLGSELFFEFIKIIPIYKSLLSFEPPTPSPHLPPMQMSLFWCIDVRIIRWIYL